MSSVFPAFPGVLLKSNPLSPEAFSVFFVHMLKFHSFLFSLFPTPVSRAINPLKKTPLLLDQILKGRKIAQLYNTDCSVL